MWNIQGIIAFICIDCFEKINLLGLTSLGSGNVETIFLP